MEFWNNSDKAIFKTDLAIQLDASCNGYQHLSLLTREKDIFKPLNLVKSDKNDAPQDFYLFILDKINQFIDECIKNGEALGPFSSEDFDSFIKLSKVRLDRTMVKKPIMTYSYNSSLPRMVENVAKNLIPHDIIENGVDLEGNPKLEYIYAIDKEGIENGAFVKRVDIVVFIRVFQHILNQEFKRLKALKDYIKGIVKVCSKLKIGVPWVLPSGAIVSQAYLAYKTADIEPFAFTSTRYNFRTVLKDFNNTKQLSATMPNLIHSLDASSIALVYDRFSQRNSDQNNLFTVHDCFGVTCDNVELLIDTLKAAYIFIYSDKVYLVELDSYVKDTLRKNFGNDVFIEDNKLVQYLDSKTLKTKTISYPDVHPVIYI